MKAFRILAAIVLAALPAVAQTKPAFDVASIKPSAPLDMMKMAAEMRAGRMPKLGAQIGATRAEYLYLSLKDLIGLAYAVKPHQITGPDWLGTQRFDINAKMPDGATKKDAPKMLQALLEERFKLTLRRDKSEHPVLGLVVGKGGAKLKASSETPKAIDESVPLKEGEASSEGPDGPVRMTMGKEGNVTINMGEKGTMSYRMDPATRTFKLNGSMITMSGFADMLTQFSNMASGGAGGRQVVDMTDLKGVYEVTMEFALADMLQMARAQGIDIPGGPAAAGQAGVASDPDSSASSVTAAVQALGLRLESRRAPVEHLIVEHAEKMPTEN